MIDALTMRMAMVMTMLMTVTMAMMMTILIRIPGRTGKGDPFIPMTVKMFIRI